MTRYVDRSRIVRYQRCPRARYWEYEYQGRGIVPVALSIPLVTGIHVHKGAEHILRSCVGGRPPLLPVETAVQTSLNDYWEEVVKRGFDIEENEDAAAVAKEQAALTEALIRLFAMKVVPWLLADYEILDVEVETEWKMAEGLAMMSRPDAVMLHRATGDIHLLSLKTKASWDARADKSNAHDDQGISETVCYEASHARVGIGSSRITGEAKVQAVLMPHLLKGDRRKDHETGQYTQASPLIRGYRREGLLGPEYAHSWYWNDETGARRGLSKGKGNAWEKFNVWEAPSGVKGWMQLLNTGTVQPEAGDPLAQSIVIPTPYYRQAADIESWKRQVMEQELTCRDSAVSTEHMRVWDGPSRDEAYQLRLDVDWPQHRQSCHYPGDCVYVPLCFGPPQMAEDPLATERYQWREPHHQAELVQLQTPALETK